MTNGSCALGLEQSEPPSQRLMEMCLSCFAREDIRCYSSLETLAAWISKGRHVQSATIVSTACPAYSYEKSGGAPPRYSYSGLGGDIGLAGARFFRSLDAVHRLCREDLGIPDLRHEVLVADFEGFTEASLRRVGVTAAQFDEKSGQTARAYQEQGAGRVHADKFSNTFGGRSGWVRELAEMMERADAGEFPALLDQERLRSLGEERRVTFEELFREPIDDDAMMEHVVFLRALELATAGKLICGQYRNPMILSISDEGFAAFFGLATEAPVLDMSGME